MSFSFSDFAAALKAGARPSGDDVLALRRAIWPDGSISDAEANSLFELNRLVGEPGPEWRDLFIEAMTDYVVNARSPRGYVDEGKAGWLISQVDRDGAVVSPLELALVVKILEQALNCPAALKSWALNQIEQGVLNGARAIDEAEAQLLRRIVFAAGGDGALVVGQDEAELLWRLKDACLDADNAPGWKTLFVQAVGNHLMAYSSYRPLERDEAARLEAFVDDHRSNVFGFFARMRGASPAAGVRDLLGGGETSSVDRDAAVHAARAITPGEDGWLQGLVHADGKLDPYEEALLAFVAEESKAA